MATEILDNFAGGMVNRLKPNKLAKNFAVDVLDAKITDGVVESVNDVKTVTATTEWLDRQNAKGTRSLVRFGENWYWSDNNDGTINSTLGWVGVEPPTTSNQVNLTEDGVGNRLIGNFRYFFTFESFDGNESSPALFINDDYFAEISTEKVAKPVSLEDVAVYDVKHFYGGDWLGYPAGSLVSDGGRVWRSLSKVITRYKDYDSAYKDRWSDDGTILTWQRPGTDDGVYWEDIGSAVITIYGANQIKASGIPKSTENQVAYVNVYRTIANGATFFRVAQLPNGTQTYVDHTGDDELILNTAFDLEALPNPPVYKSNTRGVYEKVPARYLTEVNGTFYLAVADRVYLSKQSNPHAWPSTDYLTFNDTVTAIAEDDDGVLVFTNNQTYVVVGSTIADIRKRQLPNQQGCPNWRTLAYLRDSPVWISNDGLCRWAFEPQLQSKTLRVLTEKKFTFPTDYLHAEVSNSVYHLFYADGFAYTIDFARELAITRRTLPAQVADYDEDNDRLILRSLEGTTSVMDAGGLTTYTYLTPEFEFGTLKMKRVRRLWVDADHDVTITTICDGVETDTDTYEGTGLRSVYVNGETCRRFQLKLSGIGVLDSIEMELYKARR